MNWELFSETKIIWDRMLEDIEKAKVSIELEQYSFWDDKAGHVFLEALERKHDQGVKIRLICDGYGSYPLFQSVYVKKLMQKGIQIVAFNPPRLLRLSSWLYHFHKKSLIIDSKVAWSGGLGIKKKFTNFIDTMARMEGPIVTDLLSSFETVWWNIKQKNYLAPVELNRISTDPKLFINYGGYGQKEIYEELRHQIQSAEKSIYLTTSYFFPDRNFFQLILDKAQAGVDVKIILRGKDDEFLPVRFSTSYFHKALKANIGIYRYEPAIIHAKTAIIDEKWATFGSCNLDKFSFYYNMEANVASTEPEFVRQINQLFVTNMERSRKIELKDWEKRSLVERVMETLIWPIHNYL